MAAVVRDFSIASRSSTLARPAGTQKDDVLIVIHSCEDGDSQDLGISGGTGWATLASRDCDNPLGEGGSKVYRKVAQTGDPTTFALSSANTSKSSAILLVIRGASATGIVATIDGLGDIFTNTTQAPAPAAIPASGSGLVIRAGTGWGPFSTAAWPTPAEYTPAAKVQAGSSLTMAAFVRSLVSSVPVAGLDLTIGSNCYASHGFTVLVPAGGTVPDAPQVPESAPIRGSGLYRFTVHDLLTGAYKGDIQPTGVTFDRRILEPGAFSGTLPIPNRRIANQVAKIIPRLGSDLTTGPGRITVRIWRGGKCWGEYWITAAMIQQNRRGNVSIQLRGSGLEAFLNNVPIESDLSFSSDQITNARSLISHMQNLAGANIGLLLQPGSSGQSRTLEVKAADEPWYGEALSDFATQYNGFEYVIDPVETSTGQVERWWRWGYPKITGSKTHVVSQSPTGGDLLEWGEEIDALRGATRVRVRGGTPEVEDSEEGSEPAYSSWQPATAHLAAGWPRYGQRIDHPGESTSTSALNDYAQRWIRTFAGAVRVYSCTVALGRKTTLSPSALGDQIRRIMVNAWFPRQNGGAGFNAEQRLIGIAITPVSRETGKEEAQLILEEPALPATSGDRYPNEQRRVIRRLERDVDRLSTDAKTVKGVPVPAASDVPNPPNFTSPSTQTGDFASADAYNKLRADAAALHDTVRDALNSFRAKGFLK